MIVYPILPRSSIGSSINDKPVVVVGGGAGGSDGGGAGGSDSGGAGGRGGGAPAPSGPNKLHCGTKTCSVPGNVCCHESVAPSGSDHCVTNMSECNAPSRACDETNDCGNGQVCCATTGVLPKDATVGGFAATYCIDAGAPGNCLPEPGVGKSSVQVCKADEECVGDAACIVDDCFGYPLGTCGPNPNCN